MNYVYVDDCVKNGITYWYKLIDVDINGIQTEQKPISVVPNGSSIDIDVINKENIPEKFALYQNYPNPFNPMTRIKFGLPKASFVVIEIYNNLGQKVKTLWRGFKPDGYHVLDFNSAGLAGGVYFYRMQSDNFQMVKKMVIMK